VGVGGGVFGGWWGGGGVGGAWGGWWAGGGGWVEQIISHKSHSPNTGDGSGDTKSQIVNGVCWASWGRELNIGKTKGLLTYQY